MMWHPIETCPKNGSKFAIWDTVYGYVPWVYWEDEKLISDFIQWSGRTSYWMPLPPPPENVK